MSLVLTIVRQPQGADVAKTRMTFGAAGGTIGRNADNDWQLPDPDRFVSSRHASIRCESGQYYLVDTSTNGVYYNNTEQPLGTGNQATLSQGDRLYFGEYELLVEFEQSPAADNMSLNEFDQWLDPEPASDFIVDNSNGSVGNDFLAGSEELDPLAALDKATSGSSMPSSNAIPDEDWLGASQPDNAPVTEQAFSIPDSIPDPNIERENDLSEARPDMVEKAVGGAVAGTPSAQAIPDDWDIDDLLGDDGPSEEELRSPIPSPISQPVPEPVFSPGATPVPAPEPSPELTPVPTPVSSPALTPGTASHEAVDQGPILDEIESLLAADRDISEAQQDRMDVAQRETDELDAFLGLDDTPTPYTNSPVNTTTPDPVTDSMEVPVHKADLAPENEPTFDSSSAIVTDSDNAAPRGVFSESTATGAQVEDLITALGLDPDQVSSEQKDTFNQLMADMLKESTKGLMGVLGARNAIKNEFRMNVTLIQAAENNPLKFSPNVEEALRNMFATQSNAYLPGVLAVRHGFQDIADHQIAVIAGMRQAFNSMMKQFDPKKLAMRFEKQQIRGGLMKGKSAKYWESYAEYYQELENNMDDSFQDLFGEEFAEAYEQQMNTLAASRNK